LKPFLENFNKYTFELMSYMFANLHPTTEGLTELTIARTSSEENRVLTIVHGEN